MEEVNTNNNQQDQSELFESRHLGPSPDERSQMLKQLGFQSIDQFISSVVPKSIRQEDKLKLSSFNSAQTEQEALARLKATMSKNVLNRSYLGMGYYNTFVPAVIQRNILENPGWYTQYTPYQPEISQGRLEALLNFQTMISDLTGLPIANASLLDEATAAAEAMGMSFAVRSRSNKAANIFYAANDCHPQTLAVVKTRAEALGVDLRIEPADAFEFNQNVCGILLQYPNTYGSIEDYKSLIKQANQAGVLVSLACDLLSLALITSPGELGADIAVGSSQRFGVPMGYGGPHAAFFSTKDEFKRIIPGRIVGLSKDTSGKAALRLALQTREQHIRREKATSNICTAQVLLAIMAGMYAVYHGPKGIKLIAERINHKARRLAAAILKAGHELQSGAFFDTLNIKLNGIDSSKLQQQAQAAGINFRVIDKASVSLALDETVSEEHLSQIAELFGAVIDKNTWGGVPNDFIRSSEYLTHPVFSSYHSETEFLRYLKRLESRDLSLCMSMIPLGSCTMKLNATSEMLPVTWEELGSIHPFVTRDQAEGYSEMFRELESALAEITGFDAVSLQPNAGSQGEYAGLIAIRGYHHARGDQHRNICLIPKSAHGTNPASAVMAGMKVVVVECDEAGNIDLNDLEAKAIEHKANLSALMLTYPSTHGVFEEGVKKACAFIHDNGGQVYFDGANLNALLGLVKPAEFGADVCHFNLHKTFCIPHGGGGPGMGPIAVKNHLQAYLPGHPLVEMDIKDTYGTISAAPWGSASILAISWMYIAMMGPDGLTRATETAILNANYIAKRLEDYYPVLYKGSNGLVAHECILDLRSFKKTAGIEVEDVAKRLMDYGYHAPTISWPVIGTMMIEPTESESKVELDRFCDALIQIRAEIAAIESGKSDKLDNPLKNAPHTAQVLSVENWIHGYSREQAAFPAPWTKDYKFWPTVGRIDAGYGDKNLVCSCPDISEYS
ncbi:MAG: aminomethyl-transferring glycine dehydrogenase [Bdellovibrionota bacterium]